MTDKDIALINRQQAELEELKENHLPKVEAALKRANEIGRSVDLENERLKAEIEEKEKLLKQQANFIKRLKNYDEERDIRLHAVFSVKVKGKFRISNIPIANIAAEQAV